MSSIPINTKLSLSILRSAAPILFGFLCGTYMLTIVSGSMSSPDFSSISSNS